MMRLHTEDPIIREHLMEGKVGLELESHRIDPAGHLSQKPHPFARNPYIDRDFSEAQIEINTPPMDSVKEAAAFLDRQLAEAHGILTDMEELLWPFSNPPVIGSEEEIPIAVYQGEQSASYHYRVYLAERYGKYKMTYSGIHFNYSFSEILLETNYGIDAAEGRLDRRTRTLQDYQNNFYLRLAEKAVRYSWAVVALLAASPLVDNSFYESGKSGTSIFTGFSSLRCSEFGYWNPFLPILSYGSVASYADSIRGYLDQEWLFQTRELYYPVRVKPPGTYTLEALSEKGINHIELRQIDLNPFVRNGADERDLEFLKLLLIWLASKEMKPLTEHDQIQALQNHKNAAAYDWDIARISTPGKRAASLREYLQDLLDEMKEFYEGEEEALSILEYQELKIKDKSRRYASRVRDEYETDYIGAGLRRAKEIQEGFRV